MAGRESAGARPPRQQSFTAAVGGSDAAKRRDAEPDGPAGRAALLPAAGRDDVMQPLQPQNETYRPNDVIRASHI